MVSSAYSSSSVPSTYLSLSPEAAKKPNYQTTPLHGGGLHSVRKPSGKPWKKPIAPLPPTPTRVYKVHPINFRELVQKLTGAPEFQPQPQPQPRLQSVAPPPLNLAQPSLSNNNDTSSAASSLELFSSAENGTPMRSVYRDSMSETLDTKHRKSSSDSLSSLGISLSPSSHAWCNFPLLSPGTLSSIEQSTVM